MSALVSVDELRLRASGRPVIDGVSLTIRDGEAVGVVGASGSGKTTLALAVLGHLRSGIRHTGGQVLVNGVPMLPAPPAGLRGGVVSYVGQDPGTALNPYARIGAALLTAAGRRIPRRERAALVARLLERVALPGDPAFARRYPHQLSGGQQQRIVLAAALAREPRLLVLDEPTTALDLRAKSEVVRELRRLCDSGVALLWISHDLDTVGPLVDRVVVVDSGRIVEDGPADRALRDPDSAAARQLIHATVPTLDRHRGGHLSGNTGEPADRIPGGDAGGHSGMNPSGDTGGPVNGHSRGHSGMNPNEHSPGAGGAAGPVLAVRGLTAGYGQGGSRRIVLSGIDLDVRHGECLAVLGASGIGKTTLARCLAGLHRPDEGEVALFGAPLAGDVRRRTDQERAAVQLVAQNPADALHPRQDVRTALVRPLRRLRGMRLGGELDAEVRRLLDAVGLPASLTGRLPGELSGGQRQRVALARALAARPAVLICDEVTSALDTVTQAGVLGLLDGLRADLGVAVVLITHDAHVAAAVSDRLLVLADGRVARTGPTGDLLPRGVRPELPLAELLGPPARDGGAVPEGRPT